MKAETFLYLITRGRHSGLPRHMEAWFVELAGAFYVLHEPSEYGDWVKNIEANPDVSFSIGNRKNAHSELVPTVGRGRLVDEVGESDLCKRVRASMHVKYRWTTGVIVEITRSP